MHWYIHENYGAVSERAACGDRSFDELDETKAVSYHDVISQQVLPISRFYKLKEMRNEVVVLPPYYWLSMRVSGTMPIPFRFKSRNLLLGVDWLKGFPSNSKWHFLLT